MSAALRLASLVIVIPFALGACGSGEASATPLPTVPAGWTTASSGTGDVTISVPPWIEVGDTGGTVFANEPPAPGRPWIQLMAMGPGVEQPPSRSAADARAWIEDRIASPIAGPARVSTIGLPGGTAVLVERVDGAGTPNAWRFAAYAYLTPTGMAALVIDGPPAAWTGREADLALIPQLIRFAPAHPVPAVPAPATRPDPAPRPDGG